MNPESSALANKTILVTRPEGRQLNLCRLVEQAGGKTVYFPVIRIIPLTVSSYEINRAKKATMAIFISRTAVENSLDCLAQLPADMSIVSIGNSTTEALHKLNLPVAIEAPEQNTESLLQTAAFQQQNIQQQRILIFRGVGGRALLGDSLKQRGAVVHYIETYKREIPVNSPLADKQIMTLSAITVSSNESLDNLIRLNGEPSRLNSLPITVPSQRCAKLAAEYGFTTILLAQNATDKAMLEALIDYFSAAKN